MIKIDFFTARSYGWFELDADLKPLNDRAEQGEFITFAEKEKPFRKMEERIDRFVRSGVSKEELQDMITKWETDPISKMSCKEETKWNEILSTLKGLLGEPVTVVEKKEPTKEELLLLIQEHDYNEAQAACILESAEKFLAARIKPTLTQCVQYTLEELQKVN